MKWTVCKYRTPRMPYKDPDDEETIEQWLKRVEGDKKGKKKARPAISANRAVRMSV